MPLSATILSNNWRFLNMDMLNTLQRRAVHAHDGPVAVIAGPGTGKTKTLVERIKYLVANGVSAERILALTFTKKASQQMMVRLQKSCKNNAYITTFHGLGYSLLTEIDGASPVFITESARLTLIKSLPRPTTLNGMQTRELSLVISRVKNMANNEPDALRFAAAYNRALADQGLSDFDDLLLKVREHLTSNADWRDEVSKRFDYILVDEFQDTNNVQYDILRNLCTTDNLFVIGDPQQSIYGFRGADGDIFERFKRDYINVHSITLDINYRSARSVVAIANALYPNRPSLTANTTQFGEAKAIEVLNEYSEAAWVVARIQQAIGGSDLLNAVSNECVTAATSLSDFAVLYRSRSVARIVQKALSDSGIPVQIVGDGSPYDEPQVQTIVQLLAKIADPQRDVKIAKMSQSQIATLSHLFQSSQAPYAIAERIAAMCSFKQNVHTQHLKGVLLQHKTVHEAVAYFDDIAADGFYDARAEAVTLLTIHAAKGLEFSHVLLVGAEQEVLPAKRGEVSEEQRLFFVAVTRAKQYLDILYTRQRNGQKAKMSQFIANIPTAILPRITDDALHRDARRLQKRRAKRAQTTLF